MIRDWASDLVMAFSRACLWRSRVWSRRSELMSDVSEWLATPATWAEIRARHGDQEAA